MARMPAATTERPDWAIRLRSQRAKAGLTQTELAKKAGVSQSALADYELGKRKPSYDTNAKIAHELGVPFNWLSDGEEFDLREGEKDELRTQSHYDDNRSDRVWTDSEEYNSEFGRFLDETLEEQKRRGEPPPLYLFVRAIRMAWSDVIGLTSSMPINKAVDLMLANINRMNANSDRMYAAQRAEINALRKRLADIEGEK